MHHPGLRQPYFSSPPDLAASSIPRQPRHDSPHALDRMQQRGIEERAVDAALRWGRPIRQRDRRVAWFLGYRQCLVAERSGEHVERYEGTIVVEAADGTIVTVVRSFNTRKLRRGAR